MSRSLLTSFIQFSFIHPLLRRNGDTIHPSYQSSTSPKWEESRSQHFTELSGKFVLKGDATASGSNIVADGKQHSGASLYETKHNKSKFLDNNSFLPACGNTKLVMWFFLINWGWWFSNFSTFFVEFLVWYYVSSVLLLGLLCCCEDNTSLHFHFASVRFVVVKIRHLSVSVLLCWWSLAKFSFCRKDNGAAVFRKPHRRKQEVWCRR